MFFAIRQEVCLSSEQLGVNVGLPIIQAFFLPADMIFQVCKMLALSSHQKAVNIDISRRSRYGSSPIFSFANPAVKFVFTREIWRVRGMRKKVERWRPPIESVGHCHSGGGAKNQTAKGFFGGKNLPEIPEQNDLQKIICWCSCFFFGRVVTVTTGTHLFSAVFSGSRHNSIYNDRRGPSKHPPFHPTAIVREKISWDPLVSCDSENNGKT